MLPVCVVLCMPGQYWAFPSLPTIIATGRRACLLQDFAGILQRFLSIYQAGIGGAHRYSGVVVHTGDCTAQCIPNMFCGVRVWRSCRLIHLGDVALLKEIKDYPRRVGCGVIVLIAVVIPEMPPVKCHEGVWQNAHVELIDGVSVREHKDKAWSWRVVIFPGAPSDLPGTKVPVAACLPRMRFTVVRVRPMRPSIALCLTGKSSTSCLIPTWGWTGHYENN